MDLCDALRAQFLVEVPETVLDALDVLGPNRQAAEFFAGTGDRQSAAYRAALRRVQRYRAGPGRERRSPRGEDLAKLLLEARTRVEVKRGKVREGGPAVIAGLVQVSSDKRRRPIRGALSQDCRAEIAQLLLEDLCDEAAERFTECFMEGAGWIGSPPEWLEVDRLDL